MFSTSIIPENAMTQLTLEWRESDRLNSRTIDDKSFGQQPGVFRIGRDRRSCDLVLSESSVSRLHVEIFFKPEWDRFYLRNLQRKNPPRINGGILIEGEVALSPGSTIELGQMMLTVAISETSTPPPVPAKTVLVPPANHPAARSQNVLQNVPQNAPQKASPPSPAFGLECPHCHQIASIERRNGACHHCGHFLADAESILLPPGIG